MKSKGIVVEDRLETKRLKATFLSGKRIHLEPFTDKHLKGRYLNWFNDGQICRYNSHHDFPFTMDAARSFLKRATEDRSRLVLAIMLEDGDIHIGNISLDRIHSIHQSAELAILIGEKEHWGKGLGYEASRLICDHGFLTLNLNRIACGTFENNLGMKKLAARLGMIEEGKRRQAIYKHGRYVDVIEYGVLREEYLSFFGLC